MVLNYQCTQVNQNGLVYGTFSDMVTKRHLNGRKQTVSIRNFGHSITAPYTAPYFPSDTVTIRLFTYINGPYYCARKYGPYRSTWVRLYHHGFILFLWEKGAVCEVELVISNSPISRSDCSHNLRHFGWRNCFLS